MCDVKENDSKKIAVDTSLGRDSNSTKQMKDKHFHLYKKHFSKKVVIYPSVYFTQTKQPNMQHCKIHIYFSPSLPNFSMSFAQTNQPTLPVKVSWCAIKNLKLFSKRIFYKVPNVRSTYINLKWQTL